jgi:hypothetical protein
LRHLALTRVDDLDVGSSLFEQALADAQGQHRLRAEIEPDLAAVLRGRCRFSLAAQHARSALDSARRVGEPGLLARTLAADAINGFFAGDGIKFGQLVEGAELEDASDQGTYKLATTGGEAHPLENRAAVAASNAEDRGAVSAAAGA